MKASRIWSIHSVGPVRAASAAFCAMEQMLDVLCPYMADIFLISMGCAARKPTRQPVMA